MVHEQTMHVYSFANPLRTVRLCVRVCVLVWGGLLLLLLLLSFIILRP